MSKPTLNQLRTANELFFNTDFHNTQKYQVNTIAGSLRYTGETRYELLTVNRFIASDGTHQDHNAYYSIDPETLKLTFDRH